MNKVTRDHRVKVNGVSKIESSKFIRWVNEKDLKNKGRLYEEVVKKC